MFVDRCRVWELRAIVFDPCIFEFVVGSLIRMNIPLLIRRYVALG